MRRDETILDHLLDHLLVQSKKYYLLQNVFFFSSPSFLGATDSNKDPSNVRNWPDTNWYLLLFIKDIIHTNRHWLLRTYEYLTGILGNLQVLRIRRCMVRSPTTGRESGTE